MEQQVSTVSKYHILHTRGVLLDDAAIDAVLEAVWEGIRLADTENRLRNN